MTAFAALLLGGVAVMTGCAGDCECGWLCAAALAGLCVPAVAITVVGAYVVVGIVRELLLLSR